VDNEDKKNRKLMKAVAAFYSEAANANSVFGRPATDLERHMFRIGANVFRNMKNDTLPITGFIYSLVCDPILSECNGEDFCNDEFSMLAARDAVWHAIKSAIQNRGLIVRDGLSMAIVNELPSVMNWCAADLPVLDQTSANLVVKTDEARQWLEKSGMPIPEWMAQINDFEIVDSGRDLSEVAAKSDIDRIEPLKKMAPAIFYEPFEKVLCEIERVAKNKGIPFDRNNIPCGLDDLQKLACLMNPSFPRHNPSTFAKYAHMCGVRRAQRGRPKKSRNDVLPELFPHLYQNK